MRAWLADTTRDAWRSFRSLPGWVQAWVPWLVAVNVASLGQRDHPTGEATARAPGLAAAERGDRRR